MRCVGVRPWPRRPRPYHSHTEPGDGPAKSHENERARVMAPRRAAGRTPAPPLRRQAGPEMVHHHAGDEPGEPQQCAPPRSERCSVKGGCVHHDVVEDSQRDRREQACDGRDGTHQSPRHAFDLPRRDRGGGARSSGTLKESAWHDVRRAGLRADPGNNVGARRSSVHEHVGVDRGLDPVVENKAVAVSRCVSAGAPTDWG